MAFACITANGNPLSPAHPDDVIVAAAWGQDPLRASVGSPGFDVGTTIRTGSDTNLFVGDLVFNDLDADGIQDIGEAGISGVEVTITTSSVMVDVDPVTAGIQNTYTIQTDANGVYLFTGLSRGEDYTVTVSQPAGFSPVSDPDGVLDNSNSFTLNISTLTKDFGYATGLVGDLIYYDLDGDGVFEPGDGEIGIPNVEVEACYDGSGVFASDDFTSGDYTGGTGFTGNWSETDTFGGGSGGGDILIDGSNRLQLSDSPNSIERTLNAAGFVGNSVTVDVDWLGGVGDFETNDTSVIEIDVDGPGAGGFTTFWTYYGDDPGGLGASTSVISGGTAGTGIDGNNQFSFTPTNAAPVVRFRLTNAHGGGSEDLLIQSLQFSGTGQVCVTTTTDANGNYFFVGLPADDITITVDPNSNTLPTSQIDTVATEDPDSDGDLVHTFTYPGGDVLTKDWGFQPNQITGNVGLDTTGDGTSNSNISGATVLLYSDPNGDGDPSDGELLATTSTDGSGNYAFTGTPLASSGATVINSGVPVDDYVVVEVDPAGLSSISDGDTSADAGGDAANGGCASRGLR